METADKTLIKQYQKDIRLWKENPLMSEWTGIELSEKFYLINLTNEEKENLVHNIRFLTRQMVLNTPERIRKNKNGYDAEWKDIEYMFVECNKTVEELFYVAPDSEQYFPLFAEYYLYFCTCTTDVALEKFIPKELNPGIAKDIKNAYIESERHWKDAIYYADKDIFAGDYLYFLMRHKILL